MELTFWQIFQGGLAAFLVGFSKTGVVGLGILIVPLMAAVFPAKESTGALLPMLLFADIFAVAWYRQHARWGIVLKLLPWIVPGLLLGWVALDHLDDKKLKIVLGVMVLAFTAFQVVRERGGAWFEEKLPHKWWFCALAGTLSGFATMVGNVAGPIMSIYLISMALDKKAFMGTGAWYYLIVNASKVPLSACIGLISVKSLIFNLECAPLIAIGAVVGMYTFKFIPQKWFNRAVIILAALSAVRLLVQ